MPKPYHTPKSEREDQIGELEMREQIQDIDREIDKECARLRSTQVWALTHQPKYGQKEN